VDCQRAGDHFYAAMFRLGRQGMNSLLFCISTYIRALFREDQGQDLVEYALIVALLAFGALTGMGWLAKGINHAFSNIATTLTTNVS
jgi:pilus assembly protein Flp/PilA